MTTKRIGFVLRIEQTYLFSLDVAEKKGRIVKGDDVKAVVFHGVGIVEEVGPPVRSFKRGDLVVIRSTVTRGCCSYYRASYVTDDQAILISDIFPTGYFGADFAETSAGDTAAVFGCGPVGIFTIISAYLFGAPTVIAVDQRKAGWMKVDLEVASAAGKV